MHIIRLRVETTAINWQAQRITPDMLTSLSACVAPRQTSEGLTTFMPQTQRPGRKRLLSPARQGDLATRFRGVHASGS
jgi:hypothetical protein